MSINHDNLYVPPPRKSLDELLEESINKSMAEIKQGADSDDFKDLTIANFLILASAQGYSPYILQKYISNFTYEIIEDEE